MKQRKQMMLASLVMLIVAALALTTTTYAWFSSGNTAELTDVQFTAETAQGIQISVDAVNWMSKITSDDLIEMFTDGTTYKATGVNSAQAGSIYDVGIKNQEEAVLFKPVSMGVTSTSGLSSGTINMYNTTPSNGKMTTALAAPSKNSGYYVYNLYFNNSGTSPQTLYLDLAASSVTNSETTTAEQKHIENAVRIAFVDEGCSADKATVCAATSGEAIKIWEPNAKAHDSYVTTYRYEINDDDGKVGTKKVQADTAYHYYGVKAEAATPTDLEVANGSIVKVDGKTVLMGTDTTTYESAATGKTAIATLDGGQVCKVKVYIWIEGQDVDCNNYESGGKVSTKLSFTTKSN